MDRRLTGERLATVAAVAAATGLVAGLVAALYPWPTAVRIVLAALVAVLAAVAARAWMLAAGSARASEQEVGEARDRDRQAAARLREEAGARDTVLASIPDGVVLFDAEGRNVYANPAARDLLGRRFEATAELVPAPLRDAVLGVQRSGVAATCRFQSGSRLLSAAAAPAGERGGLVLVVRDLTTQQRVDELRRDFVANASHELKTPVAAIIAITDALRRAADEDPAALARFLDHLETEAERLSSIVGDLLDLSRLEATTPELVPVRLDRVFAGEVDRIRQRAEADGLDLAMEAAEEALVLGSEGDLALMAHNLLDNAIRYTPAGGRIRVSVTVRDEWAEARVEDTGIGIPSRAIGRVFERFFRVDGARSRRTGGTGLGLAIVRHVAESHGGDVSVTSTLGAGSTFVARIPLAEAP